MKKERQKARRMFCGQSVCAQDERYRRQRERGGTLLKVPKEACYSNREEKVVSYGNGVSEVYE